MIRKIIVGAVVFIFSAFEAYVQQDDAAFSRPSSAVKSCSAYAGRRRGGLKRAAGLTTLVQQYIATHSSASVEMLLFCKT
jgi:hypothetical protein